MYYDFAVTVPANTLDANPHTQELKLTAGVIQNVRVLFPPGPHGMVKVRLMHEAHQFLPTNPDGYFASDNEPITIDEYYTLDAEPFGLTVVASSPGTAYPHTIPIRIGVLRPEEVEASSGLMSALRKFLNLIGVK